MANIKHMEQVYSFRRFSNKVKGTNSQTATLAAIDKLLVEAGDAFANKQYSKAISRYKALRKQLWGQFFPGKGYQLADNLNDQLVKSIVSYSGEWLNVLEVDQPTVGVRSRIEANFDAEPDPGLSSADIGVMEKQAAADLKLATILRANGNPKSADFFAERAKRIAPGLVDKLEDQPSIDRLDDDNIGSRGISPDIIRESIGNILTDVTLSGASLSAIRDTNLARFHITPIVLPSVSIPPNLTVEKRQYSVIVDDQLESISWDVGTAPDINEIIDKVYGKRKTLKNLPDILIKPEGESDTAIALAHAWYYESPLGLAECYHAIGDWEQAQNWYRKAARYQFINTAIEVPYLWSRWAALYRDWGDSLFRIGDVALALPVYVNVLTPDMQAAASELFTLATLSGSAADANKVIENLASVENLDVSPAISSVILDIQSQLEKIAGGLDFWGHWGANVPIWTFDYLQSVAVNFAQLAVGAERDAIGFWEKAERGELTREQLTQSVALSEAEREAAQRQVSAAIAERNAYREGTEAAELRAANARAAASDYASKSSQWIMHQALSTQLSGGEDGDASELNDLADQMIQGGYSISGDGGTLSAAESLTALRLQREYEINRLNRQASELDAALVQARAELNAANARVAAIQAAANAAQVRVQSARDILAAFEDQRFTPELWHQLGEKLNQLTQRYLVMALDIAKKMQRSYNFENDVVRTIIKADYLSETVNGLLAADSLLADIHSFTYDLITSTAPKPQPIRQTISLSQKYPFLFETQLRATGKMEFQTSIDDTDNLYPGIYAGRIEHVEVEIDGIVPVRGLSGTLTNAGISHYRVPAALASSGAGTSGLKHRVQAAEALVLSDYDARNDAILTDTDRRRRRVFEGAGVASSWTLEIPRTINPIDYSQIIDVRLTISYEARFDPALKSTVLSELASRPGVNQGQRALPLRWMYPDAFFTFYRDGILSFSLDAADFSANESDPQLIELSLMVTTSPRARANGVVLKISAPGAPEITATTNNAGISSVALAAAAGMPAQGDYQIVLDPADNPTWLVDGEPDFSAIQNIALVVGYAYTPRG